MNEIVIFSESGLKSQYKLFFEELESYFGTVQAISSIDNYKKIPKAVFFTSLPKEEISLDSDIIYFQIKGKNLSFGFEESYSGKNVFVISIKDSATSIKSFLNNFFRPYREKLREVIFRDSEAILKGYKKSLKGFEPQVKLEEDFKELQSFIWTFLSLKEFTLDITKKASKHFDVLKITSYFEYVKTNSKGEFVWLTKKKGIDYGLSFKIKSSELESRYLLIELANFLLNQFQFVYENEAKFSNIKNYENEEFPYAILASDGDLILYNNQFTELNISVRQLVDSDALEKIEKDGKTWFVHKTNFTFKDENYIYLSLKEVSLFFEKANQPSSKELGIITSSIAHELNNPLAGILAALDVLSMELEEGHVLDEIKEMKNTVIRCKKLVETFLGFSRATTHGPGIFQNDVIESFEQAIDLIRFRLIESNIKMNIEKEIKSQFQQSFNPSIFTMLFYLVVGEVVTFYGHQKLVENHTRSQLDILFEVNFKSVGLKVQNLKFDYSVITSSRLFMHLTENLGCKIQIANNMLRLSF